MAGVGLRSHDTNKLGGTAASLVALVMLWTSCGGFFVDPTLTAMTVTPATPSVAIGGTQQMTATGTYDDGSTKTLAGSSVSWTSGDVSNATVNSSGLVRGVSVGTASITATSGTISASTTVTVTVANLSSISVTPANQSIAQGATQQYAAEGTLNDGTKVDLTSAVTWSSSNTSVVTIGSNTGLATAASSVTTSTTVTITATSGNITGTTQLTVNP